MKVAVVVPAYNEEERIGETLRAIPEFVDRVIVINDGSTDGTLRSIEETGGLHGRLVVQRHERNMGVGRSIVTGYEEAVRRGADVVVVMAGDGQMAPEDLPSLLAPFRNGEPLYVKGNRFLLKDQRGEFPLFRYYGNLLLSLVTRLVTGNRLIHDSQCGYTAISKEALKLIDLKNVWRGYGYPNDLLFRLGRAGVRIREVPVRPLYRGIPSKIRGHRYIPSLSFVLLRILLLRLLDGEGRNGRRKREKG